MGSRLKENPDRTFNWFFEASRPIARDKDPGVLFQFPEDFSDEESGQNLPRFCFPYDIEKVKDVAAVQHFTFVLTDLEGCQRFGFCRLASSSYTCLCMLSYLPWFEVFYKLLNNLADYLTKGQTNEMRELLTTLYKQPLPLAVGSVTLQLGEHLLVRTKMPCPSGHAHLPMRDGLEGVPYFIAPDPRSLPSIPENRNLTELVVAVDVSNLLHLYASMLFERRILIFSSKLSTLTGCVHALSAVLYPMYWQHIFIPVLPPHLLDYCCAPMPFLIGVHTSLTERVRNQGLEDVVIFNIDTNTMESPFEDLKKIPADVVSGLKLRLKRQTSSPGVGVAKAFLTAQALLFGSYGDALRGCPDGQVRFNNEVFLEQKSPAKKQFLESAVHLQLFKQFVDGRLELLNKGTEPDDLFEQEILQCGPASGSTKTYQQLVGNLKKGGGALILNVRSKAHAYKSAKRGLRSLLTSKDAVEVLSLQRTASVIGTQRHSQSDCLQSRLPITQHFGKSRPRRPVNRHGNPRDNENTQDNRATWEEYWTESAVSGPVPDPDPGEDEDSDLCDPEEMDLLGEIFDTLSARSPHDRGLLYGTRSLDLFGTDTDFIRQMSRTTPSQESLGVSISGSGSLHSWNLEEGLQTTGEEPEETGTRNELVEGHELLPGEEDRIVTKEERREEREERSEEMERCDVIREGGQDEPGRKEKRMSGDVIREGGQDEPERKVERNGEVEEGRDGDVEGEEVRVEVGRRAQNRAEWETVPRDTDQRQVAQEEDRDPEMSTELPSKTGTSLGAESVTIHPKTTAPPALQNHTAPQDPKQPLGQNDKGKEKEEARKPDYPTVALAVAQFQTQVAETSLRGKAQIGHSPESSKPSDSPQGQVTILKSCLQEANARPPLNTLPDLTSSVNDQSDSRKEPAGKEDPPFIKVSELKKRFEA
ncbi:hypothetical protein DPEC_G00169990 [Dallia pectoralis]|uniref:Uncharacterized protein n=1 Tax=Dallia pectoralis TaxID=75939 RepID=A0ACC2GCU7_DALPE|nr:hypothetical protein DPEC_G00169990 [Dallia pectoralis]